ncbi:3-deoxy-D-manno-octulosonic acid kinase [Thalassomonas sp. M1454]|nr:3-deoxy-D-manno-octulosonic acid kinase [Thalassomonas sp. M1454]
MNIAKEGNVTCLYCPELLPDFCKEMFTSAYWQERDAILGSAVGRGTAWFVKHPVTDMVLRHYYRGGLIGKLINDSYFFTGIMNTRAAKEFALLNQMQAMQLPAPTGVAVKVTRNGLWYQGDILIELIPGATDLVGLLTRTELPDELWLEIGRTIKLFHQKNIYHHDLNAHNIMVDSDNKVWLIDFDQGKLMPKAGPWQHNNMQRLLRSFNKEVKKLPVFHWHERHWQLLMQGYNC